MKKTLPHVLAAAGLGLAVSASVAQAPAAVAPTEFPADAVAEADAALKQRFAGRVLKAQPAQGAGWRMDFKDSGYVFLDLSSGYRDTGSWRIEGTRLCIAWQRPSSGSGCNEMRVHGDALLLKRTNGEVVALRPA